jgi:hypothetical protein
MPKLFEAQGIRFYFPSNDYEPPHVHADCGNGTVKLSLGDTVTVTNQKRMKSADLKNAVAIAEANKESFRAAWDEFFGGSK